jgi:predicted metal-dependent phosphoesterase TrpH
MLIDLHNHTGWGSGDSHLDPSKLVEHAKRCGLDAIALTEHNQVWDPMKVRALRERHDFLVLAGCEVNTDEGHMLVFGLPGPRRWSRLPTLRELRQQVDEYGGVIIAAHPFRGRHAGNGSVDWVARSLRGLVDAIEAYNGLGGAGERHAGAETARLLSLPTTGGSDTHRIMDVASTFTRLQARIESESDLIEVLKAGLCRGTDWEAEGLPDGRRQALSATTAHVTY